ncbi:MAG: imidazole glycerol phosphate synthase subunit HisH [Candidatus Omnitrophota bacterium]|jgi:glutamine amidotransferase
MITIIDYGMGNLRSVSKALTHVGARCRFVVTGSQLKGSKKIILPGVGAFGDAMRELKNRNFVEPLANSIAKGAKLLGVCLGLQLLFETSEEAPGIKGLGFLQGKVQRFRSAREKIPHMGWNNIRITGKHPLLKGIRSGDYFYYVHSFYGEPQLKKITKATSRYAGMDFAAVIGNGQIAATQFHPEKSQTTGLKLLANFMRW